ncbi:uncharacterized protein CMU_028290 [Cryptosporidium muris RN66]|uniref:Uncharacterized protein n=1 Tax=Cryptosporidium muris (strain RN66) TaxID=441375 RepID=B6AK59_CRYMR|nr:uncharacterized protein CMU_028290 [Cryptosporidium muris RN66]EEA08600.1 hypothetical protein, conserved [Cryptosporidium muris RN66]|eukprot:XP_002142949.1 hypothetical protein [Cryptosporidium muris RN66]
MLLARILFFIFVGALLPQGIFSYSVPLNSLLNTASSDGTMFPYREVTIDMADYVRSTILLLPEEFTTESLKAAQLRQKKLVDQGVPCRIYRLVTMPADQTAIEMIISQSLADSILVNNTLSPIFTTVEVEFDLKRMMVDEDYRKIYTPRLMEAAESFTNRFVTVLLMSSTDSGSNYYIYLGEGDFTPVQQGASYYAYLFNDSGKEVDSLSSADLRHIEAARKSFIDARSNMKKEQLTEIEVKELAARLRVLKRRQKAGPKCSKCLDITYEKCEYCATLVTIDEYREIEDLSKKSRKYELFFEHRLARHSSGASHASLFVVSKAEDSIIPEFSQSINVGAYGVVNNYRPLPLNLGPHCAALVESDINLVLRMSSVFPTYFETLSLSRDYDELCLGVHYMSKKPKVTSSGIATYEIENCIVSMILALGSFHPEFSTPIGTLNPNVEMSMTSFCSAVLSHEPLGLVENLSPVYSPSGVIMSPSNGKIDVAVLLERSRSEESVIQSMLGSNTCSIEDMVSAGWMYDNKLKLWVRGRNKKVPLPILVRYAVSSDGRLIAIALEGEDVTNYSKGLQVLFTSPKFEHLFSQVIGSKCLNPGDIKDLEKVGVVLEEITLAELREATILANNAAEQSFAASNAATLAMKKYEDAVLAEERVMEVAQMASKIREYHDAKSKISQKAAEIAKIEEQLRIAAENRAKAANESAKALLEATAAEERRREFAKNAQLAARRATDTVQQALNIQKQLRGQLKSEAKLSAAYEAAVVAEDKLRKALDEAHNLLQGLFDKEKALRERFLGEIDPLIKEEERLLKCVEEFSQRRIALLDNLTELRNILQGKLDKSLREKQDVLEEARLKKDLLDNRKFELGKLSNMIRTKSAEAEAVNASLFEAELMLEKLKQDADMKAREAEAARLRLEEMSKKIQELRLLYNDLLLRINELVSLQSNLEDEIRKVETELDALSLKLAEIEERLLRLEEARQAHDEKSKEAELLLARELELKRQIEELNKLRKEKEVELSGLLDEQLKVRTDVSAVLVARSSALEVLQRTLKEIQIAKCTTEEETKVIKDQYECSALEAQKLLSNVEKWKRDLQDAIEEEEIKSNLLAKKIEEVQEMDFIMACAEEQLKLANDIPVPATPLTPECGLGNINCVVTQN